MAKKPEKSGRQESNLTGQTSVRLSKAFARKMAVLAKHKGRNVPDLIELWLQDKVAEEYRAMIEDLQGEFGEE